MLHLSQEMRLMQKLTPQQIQYLKLLQLPTLALEQLIKTELEINPMLEEGDDEIEVETPAEEPSTETPVDEETVEKIEQKKNDEFSFEDFLNDDAIDDYKGGDVQSEDEELD